jgi:hypothetical protein
MGGLSSFLGQPFVGSEGSFPAVRPPKRLVGGLSSFLAQRKHKMASCMMGRVELQKEIHTLTSYA